MRLRWGVAFSALMAFYYFIPELEITDSRYVLGTSDAFVRSGSLDMRGLVEADADKALVDNYYTPLTPRSENWREGRRGNYQ